MSRRTYTRFIVAAVVAVGLSASARAHAGSVFLNGANVDGIRNQVYDNARVEIDAQGNIRITVKSPAAAPQVTPTATAPAPAPQASTVPPGGPVTKRYWLVTEKAAPGMTQYDLDLFINGKWVRKFLDIEEHVVLEVSQHLRTGPNTVTVVARKSLGDQRRSSSPQHFFRLVIGEGNEGGRNVMITRKLIDYRRTALETKDFKDELQIVGQ